MWSERNGLPVVASWSHDIERVTIWNVATHRELCEPLPTYINAASAALPIVDIHHVVANNDWNAGVALFVTMTSSQLYMYCSKG
ncbi:hypothetical protein PsorP6_015972 [Peronosclerospora sorghi]|uniref:Uncharacterized protein n=1 Tax=Peronosclerospora sorghi TaxID=230839 RepID=A0ACC0WMG0_9STRA|nr:hypothetical protein PsorP6_015972 [Peronosclerospora sorghi]